MNGKICELENKVNDILPYTGQPSEMNPNILLSTSSVGQNAEMPPAVDIDWDRFNELIESNPEDAVFDMISYLRNSLARKASTKRLIEKANSQYVDSSFQRVSTQLTAMINQSILKNHNMLETEITNIMLEIDDLKDLMSHEFDEIRQMISDCKKQREELMKEDMYQATYYQSQYQSRNRYRTSSFTTPQRQQLQKQMIRPRKTANTNSKSFTATLTNSLMSATPQPES